MVRPGKSTVASNGSNAGLLSKTLVGAAALVAVLFVVAFGAPAQATTTNFTFHHLRVSDGLIQGSVQAITQDRHGFMWFGTQQGLNRYDGVNFKTYLNDPQDPHSLPSNWIWDLFVDAEGRLWVGTHEGGLALYDEEIDGFHQYGEEHAQVRDIAEDPDGILWLAMNEDGAATFDPNTEEVHFVTGPTTEAIRTKAVHIDRIANVWLASEAGLLRRDPISKTFSFVPSVASDAEINAIAGNETHLWLATEHRGALRLDLSTLEVHSYQTNGNQTSTTASINSNYVRAILIDKQQGAWLGHDTVGLNHINGDHEIRSVEANPGNFQSLINDHIRALFVDRNGLLWVGTQNGVSRINRSNNGFLNFSEDPSPHRSLTGNWISNFAEKSPTEYWVATYGGGINLINLKDESVTAFRQQSSGEGLAEDRVMALEVTAEGALWAGTRNAGVSVLGADNTWRTYRHDPADKTSLSHNAVADIYQDRMGVVWIATMGGGVNQYNQEQGQFSHFQTTSPSAAKICSDRVLTIFQDSTHALWFGTYNSGICRLDTTTGELQHFQHQPNDKQTLSSNAAWTITEDRYGNLWVGTENSGLNVWLAKDRNAGIVRFNRLNITNGLSSNVVYGLVSDSTGYLWVSSNRGISRYHVDTSNQEISLSLRHFTVDDGLPGNEFNLAAALRASNGKLLFGGTAGMTIFQPEQHTHVSPPPQIVLTEFRKLNQQVPFNLDQPEFTIEHSDNLIHLSYAALDYAAPRRLRYQHFLKGFDEDWVNDDNRSQATYTNLEPGSYEFNIRAVREGEVWSGTSLSIPITVHPPIWATTAAYASYALLAAFLAMWVFASWNRRLRISAELEHMNQALRVEVKQREQQELALKQAQQQTQQFLDVAEVPIIALDQYGTVTMINQKGVRLIGASEEHIVGKNFVNEFVPIDARAEFLRTLADVDQYSYSESRLLSSDDIERLIAWHNVRLSDNDKPANGILMSGSDITQMRKLEGQLRDGQKMEALGTLARGVAHDFNNILSAILGYAELARMQIEDKNEAKDYLAKLERSVSRAKEIVGSVLAFGRAQQLPLEMINLSSVLADALQLVRPIVPANIRLIEQIDAPRGPILANPAQITQIILNLCTNACQAMKEKGGSLQVRLSNEMISQNRARASGQLNPGPHVIISVEDSGKGMDDYTLSRMFEPFFTTQPPGRGSGLGLSVVHGVVTQIGGVVEVASNPAEGSRFEITIPCLVDEPMPQGISQSPTESRSTNRSETILFVDDEAELTHVASVGLTNVGYQVITVSNGEAALKIVQAQSIDLLVTDQTMPGMRGEELAEEVKLILPNLPILLISGADQPETNAINDFLTKPYTMSELAAKIAELLETAVQSSP